MGSQVRIFGKKRLDETIYLFPKPGNFIAVPLRSEEVDQDFVLNIRSSKIELLKGTVLLRAGIQPLVRIDLAGGIHRNPDGKEIPCPHIHIYKEGFEDKFAFPLPTRFTHPNDLLTTLNEFMDYCNIIEKPIIKK